MSVKIVVKKNEKQYNKTLIKILKDEKRCIEIKS